ncbi:hypothetical protein QG1_2097 [Clostridioides difficile CD166]|nr:hypothetical protein QG1_2097 [Clostridioides difficile CD166]
MGFYINYVVCKVEHECSWKVTTTCFISTMWYVKTRAY